MLHDVIFYVPLPYVPLSVLASEMGVLKQPKRLELVVQHHMPQVVDHIRRWRVSMFHLKNAPESSQIVLRNAIPRQKRPEANSQGARCPRVPMNPRVDTCNFT